MPMTVQERRKKDRIKKQSQRAADQAAGKPPHHAVLKAVVEANAFALAGVNIGLASNERPTTLIDLVVIMRTAVAILQVRGEFDAALSEKAVSQALAIRPEHRNVGCVPSLTHYPFPVAKAA